MKWNIVSVAALALLALDSTIADACSCMPEPDIRVFPTYLDRASTTTHAWVWIHRWTLVNRLCPRTPEELAVKMEPGIDRCDRTPKLVLRRAFASLTDDVDIPIAARVVEHNAGSRTLFEIAPESRLSPGARYEFWWDDEEKPSRSGVIGTFKVQAADDKTPPVWTAPTVAKFWKPNKKAQMFDSCGMPQRLLKIETALADDDQTAKRLFYAVSFTSGSTRPDVVFPSRYLLDTIGPDDKPEMDETPESYNGVIRVVQQRTDDDSEGCYEHMVKFPKGSTLHATIRAIDFSGNSTPAFEFDAK
jgi:hypothetical protein